MSEEVLNFLKNFLAPGEEILGPVLYAKNILISEKGNPEAAILYEPVIGKVTDVYCINTNKRILFVNVGIRSDAGVDKTQTSLATGIWKEEVGGRVWTKISQGYTLHSIVKGEVYNYRFSSNLVAEAEFPVSQAYPRILALLLIILGSVLMIIGVMIPILLILGIILLVIGIFLYGYRTLITPNSIDAVLTQSNKMIIVLKNTLPIERIDNTADNSSTIRSEYKYLFLEIEFSETTTAEEMSKFARSL